MFEIMRKEDINNSYDSTVLLNKYKTFSEDAQKIPRIFILMLISFKEWKKHNFSISDLITTYNISGKRTSWSRGYNLKMSNKLMIEHRKDLFIKTSSFYFGKFIKYLFILSCSWPEKFIKLEQIKSSSILLLLKSNNYSIKNICQ